MSRDFEMIEIGGIPYRCFRTISQLGLLPHSTGPLERASDYLGEDELTLQIKCDPVSGTREAKMHIPSIFHGFIIGKQNATRQRIQQETGCIVTVPKQGSDKDEVTLKGPTDKAILAAQTQLELIVEKVLASVSPVRSKRVLCWTGQAHITVHPLCLHPTARPRFRKQG